MAPNFGPEGWLEPTTEGLLWLWFWFCGESGDRHSHGSKESLRSDRPGAVSPAAAFRPSLLLVTPCVVHCGTAI